MHFLIRETLSFNLMYVAACYPVGTTISKTSSLFTALLQHYKSRNCPVFCNGSWVQSSARSTFFLSFFSLVSLKMLVYILLQALRFI